MQFVGRMAAGLVTSFLYQGHLLKSVLANAHLYENRRDRARSGQYGRRLHIFNDSPCLVCLFGQCEKRLNVLDFILFFFQQDHDIFPFASFPLLLPFSKGCLSFYCTLTLWKRCLSIQSPRIPHAIISLPCSQCTDLPEILFGIFTLTVDASSLAGGGGWILDQLQARSSLIPSSSAVFPASTPSPTFLQNLRDGSAKIGNFFCTYSEFEVCNVLRILVMLFP